MEMRWCSLQHTGGDSDLTAIAYNRLKVENRTNLLLSECAMLNLRPTMIVNKIHSPLQLAAGGNVNKQV